MLFMFRLSIIAALLLLLAALQAPFDAPLQVEVSLTSPPAWMAAVGIFLFSFVSLLVGAAALLLFLPWGRWLVAASLISATASLLAAQGSPLFDAASRLSAILLGIAALLWIMVICMSFHGRLAGRFQRGA